MKKLIQNLTLAVLAALCAAGLASCKGEQHWEETWRHNASSHWHNCSDAGCNERADEGEHEGWTLVSTISPATCYSRGRGIFACSVCGETKEDFIEPTGVHLFDETAEWQANAEGHYHTCITAGCREIELFEHGDLKRSYTPAGAYTNGMNIWRCGACGYIVKTEIVPATGVPVSFKVKFRMQQKDSDWASDDTEPVVFRNADGEDEVYVVQDTERTNGNFRYNYYFSEALNGNNETCALIDYDSVNEAGVKAFVVNEYTYAESGLGSSSDPVYYGGMIRFRRAGTFLLHFTFNWGRGGEDISAEYWLRVNVVSYAQYRELASQEQNEDMGAEKAQEIALLPQEDRKRA